MDTYFKLIAVPHKLKGGQRDEKEIFLPQFKRILFKMFNYELKEEYLQDIIQIIDDKIFEIKDEEFRKEFVPKFIDRCIRNALLKFDLQ